MRCCGVTVRRLAFYSRSRDRNVRNSGRRDHPLSLKGGDMMTHLSTGVWHVLAFLCGIEVTLLALLASGWWWWWCG